MNRASETHARRAYRHIRGKLLSGELQPGTRILYGPFGRELGVSATPVREAIGQLASEGFVELVPQLGAVVRSLTPQEAEELYEMREALEPFAAAKAAERIGAAQLAELEEKLKEMERAAEAFGKARGEKAARRAVARMEAADLAFHLLIIEATGNRRMIKTVGDSHVLARIFAVHRHEYDAGVIRRTCAEHSAIFRALKKHSPEGAADAMREHVRSSLQITLNAHRQSNRSRWWENA